MRVLFLINTILMTSLVNASGLKGDSVMSPAGVVSSATIQQNMGNVQTPDISSSNANEIQWDTCPSDFTYQGSSLYPTQIRSITSYYMNGQATGVSYSDWTDLDSSCNKNEEQSIACPTGFSGEQLQRRLVSTKDGKSFDYSSWNTYQNNCKVIHEGILPILIAKVDSSNPLGFSEWSFLSSPFNTYQRINEYSLKMDMRISSDSGSSYGVTLDRQSAQLICLYSVKNSTSSGESGADTVSGHFVIPRSQSKIDKDGYCKVSNNNLTAEIYGDCGNRSWYGDCGSARKQIINITSVKDCIVNVSIEGIQSNPLSPPSTILREYNICN